MTRDVFILGGKRTAMGAYVGALKDVSAIELGATAARGALAATGVGPEEIDHTSSTRLVLTLLNELGRRGGRYGLATACIGGGQGIAMICERL